MMITRIAGYTPASYTPRMTNMTTPNFDGKGSRRKMTEEEKKINFLTKAIGNISGISDTDIDVFYTALKTFAKAAKAPEQDLTISPTNIKRLDDGSIEIIHSYRGYSANFWAISDSDGLNNRWAIANLTSDGNKVKTLDRICTEKEYKDPAEALHNAPRAMRILDTYNENGDKVVRYENYKYGKLRKPSKKYNYTSKTN
jgi:hypothetical protein